MYLVFAGRRTLIETSREGVTGAPGVTRHYRSCRRSHRFKRALRRPRSRCGVGWSMRPSVASRSVGVLHSIAVDMITHETFVYAVAAGCLTSEVGIAM